MTGIQYNKKSLSKNTSELNIEYDGENFVILNSEGVNDGYLPKYLVLKVLGEPVEIVEIENHSIFIYDYDISKKVSSDCNIK